ncbi:hypothetical protein [Pseudobacteriovorax antillogorgiicola]|uniref:Lipoprotein n=1 Tax=Pseudobacteriovorax antillogorgiicola TaxID=1513793 RepID=A0A1Y6CK28_9BACT|nr:hypothetical protein [Pseudobacteriovorax antillogorgiicola]TCS48019.1 hypothetical protein EDD56_119130 [Pseudobacteriovorax antillogorgiicola]SMF58698.1 hypothetical protein SAMN06296036_119131 [Pseudobacteriovorax antillogorgiicola]
MSFTYLKTSVVFALYILMTSCGSEVTNDFDTVAIECGEEAEQDVNYGVFEEANGGRSKSDSMLVFREQDQIWERSDSLLTSKGCVKVLPNERLFVRKLGTTQGAYVESSDQDFKVMSLQNITLPTVSSGICEGEFLDDDGSLELNIDLQTSSDFAYLDLQRFHLSLFIDGTLSQEWSNLIYTQLAGLKVDTSSRNSSKYKVRLVIRESNLLRDEPVSDVSCEFEKSTAVIPIFF